MRHGRAIAGTAVLLLAAAVLTSPLGAAAPATVPAYDTGAVRMTVPAPVPDFQLAQDANAALSSSITLVEILELRPGPNDSSTGPEVVAAAYPSDVQTFNASARTTGGYQVVLTATLTAFKAAGVLFPPPNSERPHLPAVAIAPTLVTVTVRSDPTNDRVGVSTQVTNWPWVHVGDLLAVDWTLTVPGTSSFAGCTAAPSGPVATSPCGAAPLAVGASEWGSSIASVDGLSRGGPVAQLAWSMGASSAPLPTAEGAALGTGGSAEVVVATAPGASSPALFSMDYALVVPPLPSLAVLHGSVLPYVGGLAGAGLAGAVGLWAWRRREDTARREL